MIKIALGIAIVCFATFCGYMFAKKYRQRKNFFAQMNEFNERFLSEITYYRRPVREFVGKYEYKGEFDQLLRSYVQSLGEESEDEAGIMTFSFLTQDETDFVTDYFLMMGRGDSGSQKAYFTSIKHALGEYKKKSGEECIKYGDLYVKLGFLCGLALLVLII